jgi:Fe-S-cluster containining protein
MAMTRKRRRKPPLRSGQGAPEGPAPAAGVPEGDRRWVERHLMADGDLLLYGRLAEDFQDLAPEELWRGLRAAAEPYLAGGTDRTAALHREVDATLEALTARDRRFGYPPPFCHRGCSNCCHELVYCTSEEARRILDHCRAQGIPLDRALLERQLRHVARDANGDHTGATTWNDQPEADQACAFLDPADGSCRIWAVRPMVCRAHLAEGTDAHCRPRNGVEDPRALGISYLELGYLLSAVFTLHRGSVRKTLGGLLLALDDGPGPGTP